MIGYIFKRLFYIVIIVLLMSMIVFAITQVLPGNVAKMILGQYATPESLQALEKKLGLNDPVYIQYFRWFKAALMGDLGTSLSMGIPAAPVIFGALKRSAILAIMAFIPVIILGISFGILGALRKNSPVDYSVSIFSFLGISIPEFFWGIVLIILFASWLNLLPSSGYSHFTGNLWAWLKHLILPTITLTFALLAHVSRQTRSSMLEVLESNYIRAAKAKGLPKRRIILRHALKNALLPTVTVLAMDFGWLIGGIVVVESVFAFPGFGRMVVFAIEQRDLPLIQASIIIVALIYSLANLCADIFYTYLNPKIRYEVKS